MMIETAAFAGGCFWCIESAYVTFPGVLTVRSGFMGSDAQQPTYEAVASGNTDFVECVQLTYDSQHTSYEQLLDQFWRQIDPTDPDGQFADRGSQYRTAIFYYSPEQQRLADMSKQKLGVSGLFNKPIATQIKKAQIFYPAEEYHQDFARKNPLRYKLYAAASGRKAFIETRWK